MSQDCDHKRCTENAWENQRVVRPFWLGKYQLLKESPRRVRHELIGIKKSISGKQKPWPKGQGLQGMMDSFRRAQGGQEKNIDLEHQAR